MSRSRKPEIAILSEADEAALQAEIAADPDNPEMTDEQLARLRPASEVLPPALFKALSKGGRPPSPNKRVQVTLRLDPAVVATFKATGPGWQTRINEHLVKAARTIERATIKDESAGPFREPGMRRLIRTPKKSKAS